MKEKAIWDLMEEVFYKGNQLSKTIKLEDPLDYIKNLTSQVGVELCIKQQDYFLLEITCHISHLCVSYNEVGENEYRFKFKTVTICQKCNNLNCEISELKYEVEDMRNLLYQVKCPNCSHEFLM